MNRESVSAGTLAHVQTRSPDPGIYNVPKGKRNTRWERQRAARTVALNAVSTDECRELLAMLDLLDGGRK